MEVRLLLISSSPLISYLPALLLPPALSVFQPWFLSPAPPCSPALLSCPANSVPAGAGGSKHPCDDQWEEEPCAGLLPVLAQE